MATPIDSSRLPPAAAAQRASGRRLLAWAVFRGVLALVPLSGDYATGLVSEVLPTFSKKPLFGYNVMVYSGIMIGFLGFGARRLCCAGLKA